MWCAPPLRTCGPSRSCSGTARVALVGKYTGMQDAYLSVLKALKHAACEVGRDLDVIWIESSDLEPPPPDADSPAEAAAAPGEEAREGPSAAERHAAAWASLRSAGGIIVPGGFGARGVEGKVLCAKYARENAVPFLGVCLGMQMLVVEYARNVLRNEGEPFTPLQLLPPLSPLLPLPLPPPPPLLSPLPLHGPPSTHGQKRRHTFVCAQHCCVCS